MTLSQEHEHRLLDIFPCLVCKMSNLNISRSHKVSFHRHRALVLTPLTMSPRQSAVFLPTDNNGNNIDQTNRTQRFIAFIKGEGEPSWVQSYKWFFFSSFFNVLLVFVPLSAFANYLHWDVTLRFSFSFLAIVPLAKVLPILP